MTAQTAQSVQKRLSGYWVIHNLHFDARPDLYYDLTLVLEQKETNQQIHVVFRDVSNLRINDFGSGLTQVAPRIDDVSVWQWDRVRFYVTELASESFEFRCFDVEIES